MEQTGDDEITVVHSLRQAAALFKVAPDTVRSWAMAGRVEATFADNRWTIRIPASHPLLPGNKQTEATHHYPRVEDERDITIARLEAENERLIDEVTYLRQAQLEMQRQLPELAMRLLDGLKPRALPEPEPRPRRSWTYWLWPFGSGGS